MSKSCAYSYAREWWDKTADVLATRYGWRRCPDCVEKDGWWVSATSAVTSMTLAVNWELEDPDADPTLPLGEVTALVVVTKNYDHEAAVEVPDDPEAAADLINQAVATHRRGE